MIPISRIVERLRSESDLAENQYEQITQDGTKYTVRLGFRPIVSGSDEAYVTHTTFTTGLNQFVPRNYSQSAGYASGNNLVYEINYPRGELRFYQGSGYLINSTGLVPFAPWSTSTVTVYYQNTKYTDKVMSDYASFAVADVEMSLQIGMYVSGVSGVAPSPRQYTDSIDYLTSSPYATDEKFIIVEDVEIIQSLIAKKASINLAGRERRTGAGNAIRLKDGDTEVDTAGGQRWVADYVRDLQKEYNNMVRFVMLNMGYGYDLRQINELSLGVSSWATGGVISQYEG